MSKFALNKCLEYRNHPLMILLQVLWRDYDEFTFFSSAGCGRSDVHCLLNLLEFGGSPFPATSLLLCPSTL
jgi:hypothetical protein